MLLRIGSRIGTPARQSISLAVVMALTVSGCAAVLGIEDVEENDSPAIDGSGNGSGAGGSGNTAGSGQPGGGKGGRAGANQGGRGGSGNTGGSNTGGTGNEQGAGGTGNTGGTGGTGNEQGAGGTGNEQGAGGTGGTTGAIVINEIYHNEPGLDLNCFLELFGPPNAPLDGYELRFTPGNPDLEPLTVFSFGPQHRLGSKGYFVVAQSPNVPVHEDANFVIDTDTGSKGPDLFNSANSLELLFNGAPVDAVAYENATSQDCPERSVGEGDCAFSPIAGIDDEPLSISRNPFGADSDDNFIDFFLVPPTPGTTNIDIDDTLAPTFVRVLASGGGERAHNLPSPMGGARPKQPFCRSHGRVFEAFAQKMRGGCTGRGCDRPQRGSRRGQKRSQGAPKGVRDRARGGHWGRQRGFAKGPEAVADCAAGLERPWCRGPSAS